MLKKNSAVASRSDTKTDIAAEALGTHRYGIAGGLQEGLGAELSPTVLLVDDDPDSLILLEFILDQFACNTVCRQDGQAALAYVRQNPPDLILLDIKLSDMTGLEVIKALQQEDLGQAIPLVAVTALASRRDRHRILQAGFVHYISKPYALESIEALLKQYLQLRKLPTTETFGAY